MARSRMDGTAKTQHSGPLENTPYTPLQDPRHRRRHRTDPAVGDLPGHLGCADWV